MTNNVEHIFIWLANSLAIYTSSFVECPSLWLIIHLYYSVSSTYSCVGIKKVFFYIKKNKKRSFNFYDPVCQYVCVYVCVVSDLHVLSRRSLQVNKNSESNSQHSLFLDFSILDCFSISILYHWPKCGSRSTS